MRKPTLEEFNNFSVTAQRKYRKLYPGVYPDPVYIKKNRVPSMEEYENGSKQYRYYLRNRFPGLYPAPRRYKYKNS